MTRSSNQRGVSLLLLIIAITVFAAVAIGMVTLLRSRHESYAYQVQSYQTYALAHAGIEFAIRLAMENSNVGDPDSFANHPEYYVPTDGTYKAYKFGNGWFALRYAPGCKDPANVNVLYSKGCLTQPGVDGTCQGATREIKLPRFTRYTPGSEIVVVGGATRTPYSQPNAGYSGDRIEFDWCDPAVDGVNVFGTYIYGGAHNNNAEELPRRLKDSRGLRKWDPHQSREVRGFRNDSRSAFWCHSADFVVI